MSGWIRPDRGRIVEALEKAFHVGRGRLSVYPLHGDGPARRCPSPPTCTARPATSTITRSAPGSFSFNSPVGACETCRGFGRTMGIDYGLVIPDTGRSLADGAVKPFQSQSYHECQDDLLRFARRRGVPTHLAWRDLSGTATQWVIDGEGRMAEGKWYGVRRFFEWLESTRLQDARARAAVALPGLHAVRQLPRRAPEARVAVVAARHAGRTPRPCSPPSRNSGRPAWNADDDPQHRCPVSACTT